MASHPITRTKVLVPNRRSNVLSRQRLLDLFVALLDHKLILLTAPAGYGKTTLLIDLAHHLKRPFCWYSVDALDADPYRYLSGLIESIAHRFPDFGKQSRAALKSMEGRINWDQAVTAIVNDAYKHIQDDFILVVDDFHLVSEVPQIKHLVNQLVQHIKDNCHIVLSSRDLATLPELPLLVARSDVGGVDANALAFRADEIQALILQNYSLSITKEDAEALVQETEGWITGLLLSAQTMATGLADRVRVARASGVGLYDFLAQQVLDQQPACLQKFLLQTSLMEEFDPELCEAVLPEATEDWDSQSWKALIESVLRRNLFIQPVGQEDNWVRYHHLFQEFLQTRMIQRHPERAASIQRRLAAVYSERGEWERAYRLFNQLDDSEAIADLIERAGMAMLYESRQKTMADWIDALPPELTFSRPRLVSLRGIVAGDLGNIEEALALLDRAEVGARTGNDFLCLAQTLARRAATNRFAGNYGASLRDANDALDVAVEHEDLEPVRAVALRAKGLAYYRLGKLQEAIESLKQAQMFYERLDNDMTVALVHNDLGMAYRAIGAYEKAKRIYLLALEHWRMDDNVTGEASVLNNIGVLYHFTGDYEQAGRCLERAVVCARQSGILRLEAFALASIGDLCTDLEAYSSANCAYEQAYGIARRIDSGFLQSYLSMKQARTARLQGNLGQARELLGPLGKSEERDSGFEAGSYQLEVGHLALAAGDLEKASLHFRRSAQQFEADGHRVEGACAYLALAAVVGQSASDGSAAIPPLEDAFRLVSDLERAQGLVVAARGAKPLLEEIQAYEKAAKAADLLLQQVHDFEGKLPRLRREMRRQMTVIPFAAPQLVIRALGKAQVEVEGKPVTRSDWQSPMASELLFVLLAHPQGLSKEEIGATIWPESEPEKMKANFRKTIYRLRRALGQDVVLFDERTERYAFNWELDYDYDVAAFQVRLGAAEQASEASAQIRAYRKALELYNGSYLTQAEGAWAWPLREALDHAYREATLSLAKLYFERQRYDEVLSCCRRLLAEDPCLEQAHRLAMRVYAAEGNMSGVARQFTDCQEALRHELKVSPSQQTVELHELLIHGS